LGLSRLPGDYRLYALPEAFSSIRNVSRNITCPHRVTLSFRNEPTGKQNADNDNKIKDLTKTVNSQMAILAPMAEDELKERKALQKGLLSKEFTIASMVLTVSLMTDKTHQKKDTQAAKESFSHAGLDIIPLKMNQPQALLSTLPFMMSEGLWGDCKK
ncbi:type IV secretion system protein TraC, partial [Vibrio sp. F13]